MSCTDGKSSGDGTASYAMSLKHFRVLLVHRALPTARCSEYTGEESADRTPPSQTFALFPFRCSAPSLQQSVILIPFARLALAHLCPNNFWPGELWPRAPSHLAKSPLVSKVDRGDPPYKLERGIFWSSAIILSDTDPRLSCPSTMSDITTSTAPGTLRPLDRTLVSAAHDRPLASV